MKNNTPREYNRFVTNESLEDYTLRYTPKSYRKWSELLIANTAVGSISFLALEAIGATIAINYGFTTAFLAIFTASIIIFLTAIPISYHAARYNIDIDLLTRSAGFGYVGSTITSLIYASFSFIFFALEAAIMAQALELYFGLPLAWGYLLSSLIIVPIVFYGITLINKLQLWTQPIWLIMMIAPFIAILLKEPEAITSFINFVGTESKSSEFDIYYFGLAVGISLSLIGQIGEQVDYIRFMPPVNKENKLKWWTAVLVAGPGWIVLGFLKQIGGILLAAVVLLAGLSLYEAKTPIQMYYIGYQYIFDNPEIALASATFFVIVSQIKINVTNAYAGSLAWSNFFSRLTHSHPGRVVWLMFNIVIALLLMELGLFDALEKILGLYSNVAIAWIGAITADLIINKPLGLSPKMAEFKRAHLYNINPVGFGSMIIASIISIISFMGLFGSMAQSYSSIIAMFLAFILSPLIAWITKGKYYIARDNDLSKSDATHHTCEMCNTEYEQEDMAYCPFHDVKICSLCCSLDSTCYDSCKKEKERSLRDTVGTFISNLTSLSSKVSLKLFDFIMLTSLSLFILYVTIWMVYSFQLSTMNEESIVQLKEVLFVLFGVISVFISLFIWLSLLNKENRELAEQALEEQLRIVKNAEETIRRNNNHMTFVSDNANLGFWSFNPQNGEAFVNDAFAVMLGYKPSDILKDGYEEDMFKPFKDGLDFWKKLLHPDDTERTTKALSSHINGETDIYKVDYRMRRKNGSWMWSTAIGKNAEYDDEGKVIRFNGVNLDINEMKEVEEELTSIHTHTRESIEYASLIQGALIPDNEAFRHYFEDYFAIWQPKDTVGGDIYLFEELREKDECLLMVIDCTGHGVPGAFVTMLVKAIERQVIAKINNDHTIEVSPAWILSYFNKSMKQLLKQENEDSISNAGFDGGIIYYNKKENIIKFAGAETPLFYIENEELKTIKGNRHSIGYKKSKIEYEFKEHIIEIKQDMKFYLTTDGYLDQNGGEKSFPFGKKRFSQILKENYHEQFLDQKEILLDTLQEYQQNEDKNDDVTLIGFAVKLQDNNDL